MQLQERALAAASMVGSSLTGGDDPQGGRLAPMRSCLNRTIAQGRFSRSGRQGIRSERPGLELACQTAFRIGTVESRRSTVSAPFGESSFGGIVTAQATAWIQAAGRPRPRAIGVLLHGLPRRPSPSVVGGDSRLWGTDGVPPGDHATQDALMAIVSWYLEGGDPNDPWTYRGTPNDVLVKSHRRSSSREHGRRRQPVMGLSRPADAAGPMRRST